VHAVQSHTHARSVGRMHASMKGRFAEVALLLVVGPCAGLLPTLPSGVTVVQGPTLNDTSSIVAFEIAAPRFQKNTGKGRGSLLDLLLPRNVVGAVKAGLNASSNPAAFAAVTSVLIVLPVESGPSSTV
jgi:hypothetical protein